jgi:hypothetical protein
VLARAGAIDVIVWPQAACYNTFHKSKDRFPIWSGTQLLFRKHQKGASASSDNSGEAGDHAPQPELFRIDFDMMLKGSINTRRGKPIRQYGVTVNGATRLVTSGDLVDRQAYEALVAAGVVRPMTRSNPDDAKSTDRDRRGG